jgi:hypothetical protein
MLRKYLRIKYVVITGGLMLFVISAQLVWNHKHPTAQAAQQTFSYNCNGDPESLLCLEKSYQTITEQKGVATAFVKLKASYNTDPAVHANCHQLAHVIGRTEADIVNNVDTAYTQGDNFCWSGYYHGVMESIVSKVGVNNLPKDLPSICAPIAAQKPYSFYSFNCFHGLGHGIMDVTSSNLFASLEMCDLLTTSWDQQSCYGGVFMENEMDEVNPDHHTVYLKAGQPMYPCTAVADKYKQQCYLMQTSHALRSADENFSTVFAECSNIEQTYVDFCYQSLGRDASGNSNSSVGPTVSNCMLGQTDDAKENCVVGAVKDFISYYHSDTQANNLCEALPSNIQPICQSTKTQYFATL